MFTIHKTDTGAVPPWEYLKAAAGEYKVGTFLRMSEGQLTTDEGGAATHYLCMANKTNEAGDLIPVVRVSTDMILKTELSVGMPEGETEVGAAADVSSDGTTVSADGMGIALEIVEMDGTNYGDTVYVRLK